MWRVDKKLCSNGAVQTSSLIHRTLAKLEIVKHKIIIHFVIKLIFLIPSLEMTPAYIKTVGNLFLSSSLISDAIDVMEDRKFFHMVENDWHKLYSIQSMAGQAIREIELAVETFSCVKKTERIKIHN